MPPERLAGMPSRQIIAIKTAEHRARGGGPAPFAPFAGKGPSWGPPAWEKLHRWAIAFDGTADEAETWLADWLRRDVRCEGCRRPFRVWMTDHPFDPTDPFAWSWRAHGEVNRHLNKPSPTLDEARERWTS